jgi:hypothetical protein
MLDLKRRVQYKGKIYCWNETTQKIAVIDVKDVDFSSVPEHVMRAIVERKREINNGK